MSKLKSVALTSGLGALLVAFAAAQLAAMERPANKAAAAESAARGEMKTIDGLTGPAMPKGETEREIRAYMISRNLPQLKTHLFRTRYVDVEPGGIVPIHSHVNRPAVYLITSGEIMVHQSDSNEPKRLKAGDTHMSADGVAHWWENVGDEKVGIWVGDICPIDDPKVKFCDLEGAR